MRSATAATALRTLARLVLAAVLLLAGWSKLLAPRESVRAVQAYELLPSGLETLVGLSLPAIEVALGLLLLLGLATRVSSAATGVLLLLLTAAVASAWVRGMSIDCGCFGGGGQVAPGRTEYGREVARDLVLAAAAGWLALRPVTAFAADNLLTRRPAEPSPAPAEHT